MLAPKAAAACIESAPLYIGAYAQGVLALVTADHEERNQAIATGKALLARGALSHNHFDFHACAIDASLGCGDFARALDHADELERFTADEPLHWSDLAIDRARALVRFKRGERSPELRQALTQLCHLALRVPMESWT
jgi:hypothetical protein